MAYIPIQSCAFPNDLESAAKALLQEVGDLTTAALQQISDMEATAPDINSTITDACLNMSQIMATGPNTSILKTCDDVSTNFGLEHDQATVIQDEQFLFRLGIVLFDGVFYVDGSLSPVVGDPDNIEILRRLYFALGRDLNIVAGVLGEAKYQLVSQQPTLSRLPSRTTSYSDDEVRTALAKPYILSNQISRLSDNSVVAYDQSFLARNTSKDTINATNGTPQSAITATSFSWMQVDNSLGGINKLLSLGLNTSEVGSVLGNQDLDLQAPEGVAAELSSSKTIGGTLVSSLSFLNDRFDTLPDDSKTDIFNRSLSTLSSLQDQHLVVLARDKFKASTVLQTDTLSRLRQSHTDDKIVLLMEQRQEVKGIYFDAPDTLKLDILTRALNNTGPTAIPNSFLNTPPENRTYDFGVLMQMQAYLDEAKQNLSSGVNQTNISNARDNIASYLTAIPNSPVATNDNNFSGASCYSSASDVLLRDMDFDRSFALTASLGAVDDAINGLTSLFTNDIAKPLAAVILFLVVIINAINAALDRIIEMAQAQILPLKQRLNAFMSQYMSLIGNGSFDSSLLKCAVNYDIGLSTPLLDDLLALITQLVNQVRNFLNSLAKMIADLIEKLICIPFNLLNQFLGQAEQAIGLPTSVCSFPRVNMGNDLEDALRKLRNAIQFRSVVLGAFSGDLIKFRAIVNGAANKLNGFKESSICNSGAAQSFFNASLLNLSGGLLSNPLGAFGNAVTQTVGGGVVSNGAALGRFI